MKVASFNANSIRARLNIILEWLDRESPDLLCIQETKVQDKDFPVGSFKEVNYRCVFRGEKSYNGVAILSKAPLKNVRFGFDEDGAGGTRLITAEINKVPVVNTYIPQGLDPMSDKFRMKLDWFQRLYDYFDRNFRPDRALLWMGDFNVAPEPEDVYDPVALLGHVGFHPDEHSALERIKKWGFVDVFRAHQPGPDHFTFWDYRIRNAVKRKLGWRVDHIWATPPLAKKSKRSWIDLGPRLMEKPSDHTFIAAVFDV